MEINQEKKIDNEKTNVIVVLDNNKSSTEVEDKQEQKNILNKVSLVENNKIDLTEFDKKIVIKEKVERGKKKTIVSGLTTLDGFENTKKSYEEFGKKLKVKFGCGCHVSEEEKNVFALTFQGYHRDKIIKFIKDINPKVKISN